VRIVGPLYFVGTKGSSSWLFATPEGHILLNTGMPSSGPMIVESIRKLGFEPEDIVVWLIHFGCVQEASARRCRSGSGFGDFNALDPVRAANREGSLLRISRPRSTH